jgi:hypothetical protein
MKIFGYEITREPKAKEVVYPPLLVANRRGFYDTLETWQIAWHETMYDLAPIKEVYKNSSWWERLKFRINLYRDPINTIRVMMGSHTKEFCTEINQRIIEIKKEMP